MLSLNSNHSYSHTRHYVSLEQFNGYIQGLLSSDKLDTDKKQLLQGKMESDTWKQMQLSSYWRHNIFNGGLNGPFTEYFACFNPQWKVDFWGESVQPIDITYLNEHAIPRAYQSTVLKTQTLLSEKVKELLISGKQNIEIGSLACGTMYDVLGATYENRMKVSFSGFDVDKESLQLAQEKANKLGYAKEQINLIECDVVNFPLPEKQFDAVVCNGFSFYIDDESLSQLIESVERSLKPNGIFLMSFIQPPTAWQMNEEEKKVSITVREILDVLPKNWSANLRTSSQVQSLVEKSGLSDVSIIEESHQIHPLILAHKR